MNETALQHERDNIATWSRQQFNMKETTLLHKRDNITTWTRQHCNTNETTFKHERDSIATWTRQHYNMNETALQHERDSITTWTRQHYNNDRIYSTSWGLCTSTHRYKDNIYFAALHTCDFILKYLKTINCNVLVYRLTWFGWWQ